MKKIISLLLLFFILFTNSYATEKSDENKRTDFLYENWFYYSNWYLFASENITELNNSFDDFIESFDYSLSNKDKMIISNVVKIVEKRIKKIDWINYIEKLINQISWAINILSNKEDSKYNKNLVILLSLNKELNYLYINKSLNASINDFYTNVIPNSLLSNKVYQDICNNLDYDLNSYFTLITPETYKKIYWKEFSLINFIQEKSNKCLNIISDYKKWYIYEWMTIDSYDVMYYDYILDYKLELSNNLWDYYCWNNSSYKKCFWISDWLINNISTYYY